MKPESLAQEMEADSFALSVPKLVPKSRLRMRLGVGFAVLLLLCFCKPLFALIQHAVHSSLHSHILLIPLISVYLILIQRKELPRDYSSSPGVGLLPLLAGVAALGAAWYLQRSAIPLSQNDFLAMLAASFVLLLAAGGFFILGRRWMAAVAFPVAFLIFMVPLPDAAVNWLETASKLASAEAADWFFQLSRTPVLRNGNVFQLPGITIEVAQECSGIRSSWVLFITSLLASHLFLKSPWRRIILVAFVFPLGILRNGFRILVIGLLCVHIGPEMIHSVIHHRGGPLFFALSLGPLFLLMWWLRRGETGRRRDEKTPTLSPGPDGAKPVMTGAAE